MGQLICSHMFTHCHYPAQCYKYISCFFDIPPAPHSLCTFRWCFIIWGPTRLKVRRLTSEIPTSSDRRTRACLQRRRIPARRDFFLAIQTGTSDPVYGGVPSMEIPKHGWFVIENPFKIDDFGGTPISGNHHIVHFFCRIFWGCTVL